MKTEKILVFSDSHGSSFVMKKLLENPPAGLTAVFHLGDGSEEAELLMRKYPMYAYIGVRGNCDFGDRKHTDVVYTERGGVKFMLTHGHAYGVKSSVDTACITADAEGAQMLLYGHTHIPDDRIIRCAVGDVRAVNPGSVRAAEYAVIEVTDGEVQVELKKYNQANNG